MADFTAGQVLTAAQLDTAFNTFTINAQTGTTYTLGAADAGELVTVNNNSGGTVTIPANATTAFEPGTHIAIMNAGTAGTFTVAAAGGVTLNAESATLASKKAATLVKTATNTWYMLPFSSGSAAPTVTGTTGSPSTSTVTLSGITGTLYDWSGNGSITFGTAGRLRALIVGGGGGYETASAYKGSGGHVFDGWIDVTAATHTITVGAGGGNNTVGGSSSLGSIMGSAGGSLGGEVGAGAWTGVAAAGQDSDITGSTYNYAAANRHSNIGDGASNGGTTFAGRVYLFIPD